MKLIPVNAGDFRSDGGALFSVIPKVLWNKVMPCDENNYVMATLRCLLIEHGNRKILIDAGTGDHYDEKFIRNHYLGSGSLLEQSLKNAGYEPDEITDVILTHLHWDHFNGSVKKNNGELKLTFPNAIHWCSLAQWEHSRISNARERVAYYPELHNVIHNSGKFCLVEEEGEIIPQVGVRFFNGHTPGQMIPFISYKGRTIVFMADFIPTSANIPLVWLASYDLFPVTVLEEKEKFLKEAVENGYILFFEHDYYNECVTVGHNGKGYQMKEALRLSEI